MTNANLASLHRHLVEERALDAGARPSHTGDDELDRAIELVRRADAALTAGHPAMAAQEMAEQAYVAGDSWPYSRLGAEVLRCSQALSRLAQRS